MGKENKVFPKYLSTIVIVLTLGIIGGLDTGLVGYAALVSPSAIATKITGAGVPIPLAVVFDVDTFHPPYWDNLTEEDRIEYYGPLGYGDEKLKLFTFICEMRPQSGHCVLIDMESGKVETMRHVSDFRLATDDEC